MLRISVKTVGPYNHKSLQAEHGIKSLPSILSKHLTGQGQTWHKFLSLPTFAYNIFHTPNLGNYSLYELMFVLCRFSACFKPNGADTLLLISLYVLVSRGFAL